ncbi:PfkB family carbohydrate kinase [Streptomyces oceani]|uniref:Carbohydrate kinase PfkB domain-containing protein n=1 Tax=Streptomyces oceani TaxID=1075402 RepID=A0A1E7KNX3_9ACTN|nr:PfkB family carbohydrate kinase [Streptomyces oceani]OEV05607.1 hypothetical protein AN216_02835 [Streptomyces oceani]
MTSTVIGEVLVDLVWRTGASTIVPIPGGSPANVAIGLHRLGRPTTLATCWGDDPPGSLVAEYLRDTGLPVRRATSGSGRTTQALAYVDGDSGAATYDFLAAWDPQRLSIPPEVRLLHTGSLAIVVQPGAEEVLNACQEVRGRDGGAVAVDLNVRPAVQPDRAAYRRAVERVATTADVIKASDEDLSWLYPGDSPEEAARQVLGQSGARLFVLTRGASGATGYLAAADAEEGSVSEVTVPAPAAAVVDTIGAGDSFQAALLAALLTDSGSGEACAVRLPSDATGLRDVLLQAVTAGALACGRAGAQPPTREELDEALRATASEPY